MSDTPETEKDEIGLLIDKLDELITESIPISKPIGLTLCDASRTIAGKRDRITELWSALELVRRERDEARRNLAAANKGAETNAKVNQILCKKLFRLIRRLKRREKEYLNASLGELCEDLFSRNRYEGESIGTRWAREDLELILSKLKIKEEAK